MSLDDIKLYDVRHCKPAKEMWDTREVIYIISPSIKREKMNTQAKKI